MSKSCGFDQVAMNQPRKKGLQNKPLTSAKAAPPPEPCQLLNLSAPDSTYLDEATLCKTFVPMQPVESSGMSTGVPSSVSDYSDDDFGRYSPSTPPMKPFALPPRPNVLDFVPPPPVPISDAQRNPKKNGGRPQQPRGKRQGNGQQKTYMGIVLSRGSKNHHLGQCRPCQKCNDEEGCSRGADCNFCHYPHDGAKMAEVAVYSVKAQLRRLVADQDSMATVANADVCTPSPPPGFEQMYVTCGPVEPCMEPCMEFQRMSF